MLATNPRLAHRVLMVWCGRSDNAAGDDRHSLQDVRALEEGRPAEGGRSRPVEAGSPECSRGDDDRRGGIDNGTRPVGAASSVETADTNGRNVIQRPRLARSELATDTCAVTWLGWVRYEAGRDQGVAIGRLHHRNHGARARPSLQHRHRRVASAFLGARRRGSVSRRPGLRGGGGGRDDDQGPARHQCAEQPIWNDPRLHVGRRDHIGRSGRRHRRCGTRLVSTMRFGDDRPSVRSRIAATVGPEVVAVTLILALSILILMLFLFGSPSNTGGSRAPIPTASADVGSLLVVGPSWTP